MEHLITKLGRDDIDTFVKLLAVFADVFEMQDFTPPSREHLSPLLAREDFLVFVAMGNDEVIGGLTAHVLPQYYTDKPLVYLYDLGVAPAFQRQGIGGTLLSALNAYAREIGAEEVFVQADVEDSHALDFYRKHGGQPESVVHFTYPL